MLSVNGHCGGQNISEQLHLENIS